MKLFSFLPHSIPELLESLTEDYSSSDIPWTPKPFTCTTNISKGFQTSSNCINKTPYDFDKIDIITEKNSNINAEFNKSLCVIPYKPEYSMLHNKSISYCKQPTSTKKITDIKFDSGTIEKTHLLNGSDSKPCANHLNFVPIHKTGFGVFKFPENRQLLPERSKEVNNQRNVKQIGLSGDRAVIGLNELSNIGKYKF